jgi:hypothetical protein
MATEVVASWRNNHDESLMTLNHHQQPLSQHVFASDKIYILNQDGVQRFPHLECRRCQLTHTHTKREPLVGRVSSNNHHHLFIFKGVPIAISNVLFSTRLFFKNRIRKGNRIFFSCVLPPPLGSVGTLNT